MGRRAENMYTLLPACAGLSSLAVQADVSAVASGSEDGAVCISNLQSGRILGTLQGGMHWALGLRARSLAMSFIF